jgi:twitching motility protein PilT
MMQTGQNKYGMQTFNQALATLVYRKLITQEQAVTVSSFPDELTDMMSRGAGLIGAPAPGAGGAPAAGAAARRG